MACADFYYSPNGRRGIGVNQPQSGLDYPFVSPSADIQNLVADFYFEYPDTPNAVAHPLRVDWIYGLGCLSVQPPAGAPTPTHAADILIVDATNAPVFDSTQAGTSFEQRDWGLSGSGYDYKIYEWRQAEKICRLVAYTAWPLSGNTTTAEKNYPAHIKPENAVIDERAVYKVPKYVSALILPALNPSNRLQGDVEFVSGRNMVLTPNADTLVGLRKTNQVTVSAIAGAGAGNYWDCEDPPLTGGCGCQTAITSLNGATGPDVLLTATDCLWLRTPGNVTNNKFNPSSAAEQQIGSDCQACCTCNDYVDIARYINLTRDLYKNIGVLGHTVLLNHAANINRWQEQQACRTTKPIKACMTPQRCQYLDVVAQYCNVCYSQSCAENTELVMTFTATGGNTAELVCGYSTITAAKVGTVPAQINGSWPQFTAALGNVNAGNSASATFRLKFKHARPTAVTLTVTGQAANGAVLAGCSGTEAAASVVVSRALNCAESGATVLPCEEPLRFPPVTSSSSSSANA